ncbi:unnamed protein product, partial [Lampetra planeri]
VQVKNPYLDTMEEDILYHFSLSTKSHNLPEMFGDIKFVCVGGSANRMKAFAQFIHRELTLPGNPADVRDILRGNRTATACTKWGRCCPSVTAWGVPSISIMLHELIKLLHHAQCRDVVLFRLGTSGGVGLAPGTVVVTDKAVDYSFRPQFEQVVLGKVITRQHRAGRGRGPRAPAVLRELPNLPTVIGNTMCTHDFYEAAVICVTLLNRFEGDQITSPHDVLVEYQQRPQVLVSHFIKKRLGLVV